MPDYRVNRKELETFLVGEMKALRKARFIVNPDFNGGTLLKIMGCTQKMTIDAKAARFIALVEKYVADKIQAEILLAAMGLLKGYEHIERLKARREFYYRNGFSDNSSPDVNSMLEKRENTIITNLAQRIAWVDDLADILAKEPQAMRLPTPQYYEKRNAEAGKQTDKRGPFARYIESEQPLIVTQSFYDYRANTIPFHSRQNEFSLLDKFCEDTRLILWWAIIGGGGSGKSRLAHEYMQARSSGEWRILFLREEFFVQIGSGGKYQQFTEWSHSQNLLLIVDSVQRYSKAVAQWIESVFVKKATGRKIRILLLDRNGEDGLWYWDFIAHTCLIECRYNSLLKLQPLTDGELRLFAREYAQIKNKKVEISKSNIDRTIKALIKIDGERRILYFILLLDRNIEKGFTQAKTNKIGLLDYIVENEIRVIRARFGEKTKAFKSYMQLLVYATATTNISVCDPPEWLQERCAKVIDEFTDTTSAEKAMAVQDGVILPFEPDLIGEYLVLTSTREYFPFGSDVEWFVKHAWDNNPEDIANFLMRIKMNFGVESEIVNVGWLKKMIDGPLTDNEPSFHVYFNLLSALSLYCHKPLLMSQAECASKMQEVHKRFQRDEYMIDHMTTMWYMCQALNVGPATFIWVIEQIDLLLKNVPDKYEVIYTCAQILNDISVVQSRRLDVYEEIRNGNTTNLEELFFGHYDENGKFVEVIYAEMHIEDAQVIVKALQSLFDITLLMDSLQKNNVDIIIMYTQTALLSIKVLPEHRIEILFEHFVEKFAIEYNDMLVWKHYISGLLFLAMESDDSKRKERAIQKIHETSDKNTDNKELVLMCRQCIDAVLEGKI